MSTRSGESGGSWQETDAQALHEAPMRAAIAEAEKARGKTDDNPWVGAAITDPEGNILALGHTHGAGQDHAEIAAMRAARARGADLACVTLYSTLEPCSFHGRTPACALAIVAAGVPRVVTGICDPNPRVDGAGLQILRDAGVEVIHGVCTHEIRRQLGRWIFEQHPHEALRHAETLLAAHRDARALAAQRLSEDYGIELARAERMLMQIAEKR